MGKAERLSKYTRILALILVVAVMSPATEAGAVASYRVEGVSGTGSTVWIAGGHVPNGGFASRSTDFGSTFTSRETPNAWIRDVDALSGGLGAWAVSTSQRNVFRTTDGGSDFGLVGDIIGPEGAVPKGVVALPSGAVAAVGLNPRDPFGQLGSIWRSPDTLTWTVPFEGPMYETVDPGTGDPVDPVKAYAELYSVDATSSDQVLWTVGNEWDPVTFDYRRPLIYKSVDAGASWTTQTATSAMTSGSPLWSVAAASASTAFIGVGGADTRKILRTTDGGTTWARVDIPWNAAGAYYVGTNGIDALDNDHVLTVGNGGKIAWTSSASETTPTWSYYRIYTALGGYPSLYDAYMLDATHWVVVGDNETVYRTSNAGATWSGSSALTAPSIKRLTPAAGFSLNAGAVSITGTSTDVGVGVASVEVRVRRADGMCWNGVQWDTPESWLKATPTGAGSPATWATWSYSWTPDLTLLAGGQMVTVTSRVRDGMGLQTESTSVSSAAGIAGTPAISLADSAPYTSSRLVTATVSPEGFTYMRWREGAGAPGAWVAAVPAQQVDIGTGDGVKTVVFDFSVDASTTSKSATDTIILDATQPTVAISSPVNYFTPTNLNCSGVSADSGSGIQRVEVRIASGSNFWDGSAWSPTEKWLAVSGGTAWTYPQLEGSTPFPTPLPLTLTARATDVVGNSALSAPVVSKRAPTATLKPSSNGPVAYSSPVTVAGTFTVNGAPANGLQVRLDRIAAANGVVSAVATLATDASGRFQTTVNLTENSGFRAVFAGSATLMPYTSSSTSVTAYAQLTTATLPTTIYRNRGFTATGKLYPRHLAGTSGVKLEFWRLYRNLNGTVTWKYVKQAPARLSDTVGGSSYTAVTSLPYAGTWRVRAVHADASHVRTNSVFKTFSVR
jgi:hypothetical protein